MAKIRVNDTFFSTTLFTQPSQRKTDHNGQRTEFFSYPHGGTRHNARSGTPKPFHLVMFCPSVFSTFASSIDCSVQAKQAIGAQR
jgi:hypothetical protein